MYGRSTRGPGFWWDDDPFERRPVPKPKRPVKAPDWTSRPLRARTPPPKPPASDSWDSATPDGEVKIRRKPSSESVEEPTPVGAPEPPRVVEPPPLRPEHEAKEAEPSTETRLRNAIAELNASKERLQREQQREVEQLRSKLIRELLPVLDNLDRSLDAAANSPDKPLHDGVKMVRDQFEHVLRGFGVDAIEAENVDFDPAVHEALSLVAVDDPGLDRKVVDVVRPGYRHDGRLLRAAQVTVGQYRPIDA